MNDELIKNLSISCNHSRRTVRNYKNSLRKYCEYYDMSLQESLDEAEEDEKNNVRWKYCSLRTKLIEYRHHLLEVHAWNTVKKEITSLSKIVMEICYYFPKSSPTINQYPV